MTSAPAKSSTLPKYLDLCREFETRIEAGELKPGDRLPSFARLREEYGTTTATVERTLRALENKGLIRREACRGIFVTARGSGAAKGVIGLLSQTAYRLDPYYVSLLHGAQDKAQSLGLGVMLLSENSVLHRDKVDGLLLMGAHDQSLKQIPVGMPRVQMMGPLAGIPSVYSDDRQGTVDAVEHLLDLGHRRIGFLSMGNLHRPNEDSPVADFASQQRYHAYLETLTANGITPNQRWARSLRDVDKPFPGFPIAGREKMQQWLEDDWKELNCTALLTQNDEVAVQVIQVLHAAGYSVPRDISVIGFDNTSISTKIRPHLTTVDVGLEQAGARSVELLLEMLSGSSAEPRATRRMVVLPTTLIVRESTGPAPVR